MRKFSRWMPPAARQFLHPAAWLVVAGLAAAFVGTAIAWPYQTAGVCAFLAALIVVTTLSQHSRLRELAAGRAGEDIGTFARGLDRRTQPFDPWVVRATWDALRPLVSYPGGRVPLRPTDSLVDDLRIDPDLIEDEYFEIAERAGRCLDGIEANPHLHKVRTVGDLVRLVSAQPLTASAAGRRGGGPA